MQIEKKELFLYQNIHYILAPYYLFEEKVAISLNTRKIKTLDQELLVLLTNYLLTNNNDLEKYILTLKENREYQKKYRDTIYLALACEGRLEDNRNKFMVLILDSVKKYLNKDSNNQEKLLLLKKYYEIVKKRTYG